MEHACNLFAASLVCLPVFYLGINIGVYSYFLWLFITLLRPFFNSHSMVADLARVDVVLAFLGLGLAFSVVQMAVTLSVLFSTTTMRSKQKQDRLRWGLLWKATKCVVGLSLVVLSIFTTKYAWDWWHFFASRHDSEVLRKNCQALAIILIINLCSLAFHLCLKPALRR